MSLKSLTPVWISRIQLSLNKYPSFQYQGLSVTPSLVLGQKEPMNDLLERLFVSPGSILVLFFCRGSCSRCVAGCCCVRSSILLHSCKFAMPAH